MIPLIAADWLQISINLLLVIHVIVCLLLALVVLMQRPKQEGMGAAFGSGLTDQAFGARTTDVLQKGTVYLGSLFFIITLILAILIGKKQNIKADMSGDEVADTEETMPAAVPSPLEDSSPVEMPKLDEEEVPQPESTEKPVTPVEETAPPAETPETPAEEPAPSSE